MPSFEPKSNVLIATDTDAALEKLGKHIDAEILEAMGGPAPEGAVAVPEVRLPSRGATASRECIHFYLLAYARSNRIPLLASQQPRMATKSYPEADLWMSERGIRRSSRSIDGSAKPSNSRRRPPRKDGWILTRNVRWLPRPRSGSRSGSGLLILCRERPRSGLRSRPRGDGDECLSILHGTPRSYLGWLMTHSTHLSYSFSPQFPGYCRDESAGIECRFVEGPRSSVPLRM